MATSKETYHHWIMVAVLVAALAFVLYYLNHKTKPKQALPTTGPSTASHTTSTQAGMPNNLLAQIKGYTVGVTPASQMQAATLSAQSATVHRLANGLSLYG